MKSKDIGIIAVVVLASAIVSFFLSQLIFKPNERKTQVEVIDPITTDFNVQLDKKYFNAESINPTQQIQIGGDANQAPFNDGQNGR
jgi:hypothetical protein